MSFTAKDVMALRQKTGLGMMDCKSALKEANGDSAKAEELLKEKRKGKMDTRTERATGEGRIGIVIEGPTAAIVEIRTESDFTARNEEFVKMVDDVTAEALRQPVGEVTANDTITKAIDGQRMTTGENVNFARGEKLEGGAFGMYLHHDGKRGVLVQIDGSADDDLLKGLCQHIVFHDPMGISEDDVPASQIESIKTEALEEAKASGKNDEIAEKIATGKVRKYLQEKTLLHQKYVLDESKMVKEILPSDLTIKRFVRYTLGS